MSEPSDRDAMWRQIAAKRVVYRLPGMDTLTALRQLTYRAGSGAELPMDVYYPALSGETAALVVMPMAYPDPTARVRTYGPLTSWARLVAASGIAAVVYGTEAPEEDIHALLRHLRTHAASLNLDADRFGVFATSGNVTVGLSSLMRDRRLRCGALLYGYTMDLDGSTVVADMASEAGFVDACVGKSADDLPGDVPLLFVRAGRDQFPGLNVALDKVIGRALARNLPLWLINHAEGAHGFDVDEDTAVSRAIVRQVLSFLRLHLAVA